MELPVIRLFAALPDEVKDGLERVALTGLQAFLSGLVIGDVLALDLAALEVAALSGGAASVSALNALIRTRLRKLRDTS